MPNWRTQIANGLRESSGLLGQGQIAFVLVDENDGDLSDNDMDAVRAYGLGRVGDAVRARSVLLRPTGPPGLSCLDVAMHAGHYIYFQGVTFNADQPISTNTSAYVMYGSQINADVEAQTGIYGVTYNGAKTTPATARELPNPADVFEYYIANGTEIPLSSLRDRSSHRAIEDAVLTPTHNPFPGGTNPQGIYIIDCDNQPVYVTNSRIVGTLVLLNAPTGSYSTRCTVRRYVSWEPAVSNFPALMVDGSLALDFHGDATLDEAVRDVNYNPPGAPYEGEVNLTKNDVYPSRIKGMVYADRDVYFIDDTPQVHGLIVAGNYAMRTSSSGRCTVTVTYDPIYRDHPPPGFSRGPLAPEPGTWKWDSIP
jgi:hypothetical protein